VSHTIDQCKYITADGIRYISEGCPDLEELSMQYINQMTDPSLQHLSKGCRSLRKLDCYDCIRFTGEGLQFLAQGCSKLEWIRFCGCTLTNAGVITLVQNCKDIQFLTLYACKGLDGSILPTIAENCTKLNTLDIWGATLTPEGKDGFVKLKGGAWNASQWHDKPKIV